MFFPGVVVQLKELYLILISVSLIKSPVSGLTPFTICHEMAAVTLVLSLTPECCWQIFFLVCSEYLLELPFCLFS